MKVALILVLILIFQVLFTKLIKKFVVKRACYFISIFLTFFTVVFYHCIISPVTWSNIPYFLIVLIMINLSFVDCKHYEISGNSYWFLLFPAITVLLCSRPIFEYIISFVILFLVFFIVDKIIGIEKIGGADVKILLLLSITMPYYDVFMFLVLSFVFDVFIYTVKYIYYKIVKNENKVRIPMITAITIAWMIIQLFPTQ